MILMTLQRMTREDGNDMATEVGAVGRGGMLIIYSAGKRLLRDVRVK